MSEDLEPADRLLTPREASAVLRLSPVAIARHADAGRIDCVRTPWRATTLSRERRERCHRRRRERPVMSSVERADVERSIRREEYMHMLLAGLIGMCEQNLAGLKRALAADDAARAAVWRPERRVSIPAQRKGEAR